MFRNKTIKKIMKEPIRPPKSKRHCSYCDKLRKFVYNPMIGHSECIICGCRFTKKMKGGNKRK